MSRAAITVFRHLEVPGWDSVGDKAPGAGWRFDIHTGSEVCAADVLHERIRVMIESEWQVHDLGQRCDHDDVHNDERNEARSGNGLDACTDC